MIKLGESEHYKEEILRQIEEYKDRKNLTKQEVGIALYMKADIFGQFGIMTPKDTAEMLKKIVEVFGLDLNEME